MIKKLQKKYALSEQGAKDLIKGCLACVLQNLSFMFPVGLLYYLVSDLMNGGVPGGKIPFYMINAPTVICPDSLPTVQIYCRYMSFGINLHTCIMLQEFKLKSYCSN